MEEKDEKEVEAREEEDAVRQTPFPAHPPGHMYIITPGPKEVQYDSASILPSMHLSPTV